MAGAGPAVVELCWPCMRQPGVPAELTDACGAGLLVCSTLGSALMCAVLPHHFVRPPSTGIWLTLLGTGVISCGVQLMGTLALKLCSVGPLVATSYLAVLWGLLFDTVIFHQPPSALALLGAGLVCSSSFVVVLDRRRAAKLTPAQPPPGSAGPGGGSEGYELVGTSQPGSVATARAETSMPAAAAAAAATAAEEGGAPRALAVASPGDNDGSEGQSDGQENGPLLPPAAPHS